MTNEKHININQLLNGIYLHTSENGYIDRVYV